MDGVILSRTMNDDPSIDLLQQYGVPFVAIGRIENDDIPQADNDQLGAASEMTRVLFQMGARRIAYLGGSGTTPSTPTACAAICAGWRNLVFPPTSR